MDKTKLWSIVESLEAASKIAKATRIVFQGLLEILDNFAEYASQQSDKNVEKLCIIFHLNMLEMIYSRNMVVESIDKYMDVKGGRHRYEIWKQITYSLSKLVRLCDELNEVLVYAKIRPEYLQQIAKLSIDTKMMELYVADVNIGLKFPQSEEELEGLRHYRHEMKHHLSVVERFFERNKQHESMQGVSSAKIAEYRAERWQRRDDKDRIKIL